MEKLPVQDIITAVVEWPQQSECDGLVLALVE